MTATVTGDAYDATGLVHAMLWTVPVPEPVHSTVAVGMGLLASALYVKCRSKHKAYRAGGNSDRLPQTLSKWAIPMKFAMKFTTKVMKRRFLGQAPPNCLARH